MESAQDSSLIFTGTASHLACSFHTEIGHGSKTPLGLQSSPNDQGPTCSVTSVPRALKPLGKADDPVRMALMPLDWRELGRVPGAGGIAIHTLPGQLGKTNVDACHFQDTKRRGSAHVRVAGSAALRCRCMRMPMYVQV